MDKTDFILRHGHRASLWERQSRSLSWALGPNAYAVKNWSGLLRLCNLAILSIENEVAKSTDNTNIVDDFASMKAIKVL